jgi:hypothetical protein
MPVLKSHGPFTPECDSDQVRIQLSISARNIPTKNLRFSITWPMPAWVRMQGH